MNRLHFAKKEETLQAAGDRLARLADFLKDPGLLAQSRSRLGL